MIVDKCVHVWKKHTNATRTEQNGAIPAYYLCEKCKAELTSSEVFQLESLEQQRETLSHLSTWQKYTAIISAVVAILSLLVALK